jgi:hypothetical protein
MQIAECPNCGHPISDDEPSVHTQIILATGQLVVATQLIGLMLEHPDYTNARPGYEQRMKELIEQLRQAGEDITSWGEAYDDGDGA